MAAYSSVGVASLALKQILVAQRKNKKRVKTRGKKLATREVEVWRRKDCKVHATLQWNSLLQRGT